MTIAGIGDGCKSPVAGSDSRCGEASLDSSPSILHGKISAPKSEKSGALFTPLAITSYRDKNVKEIISSTLNMNYEVPSRRPRTPSKFIFFSDRKSVPTDMKNLQERTIKRRRELVARMHDLDCHQAKIMSQYAEERMNLDLATCDTFERTVIHPLMTSVERLAIHRESSTNRLLEMPALERRIGQLDAQMTRHTHVIMSDAKIDMLDCLQDELQRNLKSEIRAENNTFNKIEGGIIQRFEAGAGTINSHIYSEGASRRSGIALLQRKIENPIPKRFERAEITLSQIASLREQLQKERVKRQATDKAICEDIVRRTSSLKRAMIAMASDGDCSRCKF